MEDFESNIKEIRKIYQLISGKECEVHCTYKGTSYGVVKSWNVKIDNREVNEAKIDVGAINLLNILKEELAKKISNLEDEAKVLRSALGAISN